MEGGGWDEKVREKKNCESWDSEEPEGCAF